MDLSKVSMACVPTASKKIKMSSASALGLKVLELREDSGGGIFKGACC